MTMYSYWCAICQKTVGYPGPECSLYPEGIPLAIRAVPANKPCPCPEFDRIVYDENEEDSPYEAPQAI